MNKKPFWHNKPIQLTYKSIHKDFRLNGIHYSREELKEVAYRLAKEGETFEKSIGDFLLDWLSQNPTVQVQTSGSTGKPKKIELQKRHMVNSAEATGAFFGLATSSSALLCLPTDFIAGKMMLVRAMVLGLELDYISPSLNPLQDNIKPYDFSAMVPLQVENSLKELNLIKTLIVGGAPVSNTLKEIFNERVKNTDIYETYGMTETITHIAAKKIHPLESEKQNFKTLPKIKISVDDKNCLVIDAPKICEDPITTNDVVNLISDNEFSWLGRLDNVINSGGVKLFPEQIETKFTSLIKSRFFVAGLPDEILGQKLVLIVESETIIDDLPKKIAELPSLGNYETPKAIYSLPAFLETETGKIRRKQTLGLLRS